MIPALCREIVDSMRRRNGSFIPMQKRRGLRTSPCLTPSTERIKGSLSFGWQQLLWSHKREGGPSIWPRRGVRLGRVVQAAVRTCLRLMELKALVKSKAKRHQSGFLSAAIR